MAKRRWASVEDGERSRLMQKEALARWERASSEELSRAAERAALARKARAAQLEARQKPELRQIARKYVWWREPELTLKNHRRHFLLHVMQFATWDDAMLVLEAFGHNAFRNALRDALPGILSPRSWNFWHIRLGLANSPEAVPPMPGRKVANAKPAP